MKFRVSVKDRGRDLAWHVVDEPEEADELRRVYEALGYPPERIIVETEPDRVPEAA